LLGREVYGFDRISSDISTNGKDFANNDFTKIVVKDALEVNVEKI